MLDNTYKVTHITYYPKATCFCPLGRDWYVNEFTIDIDVHSLIPDYCELDKWIEENITGRSMIIEEAVARLYDYINKEYKPDALDVTSRVESGTHAEVIVTRNSLV